jgi:hypothetical protein
MATQEASSVAITGGSITGLTSLRVSGQSYEAIGVGTLNVAANSSLFGTNSFLTAAANSISYWTCQSQQFQLSTAVTAATCYFGTTWTNLSDARIKKDVATYSFGTEALNQLRPVTYVYNGQYGSPNGGATQAGLIAQEVLNTPLASMVGTRVYTNPETGEQTTLYDLNTNQLVFALINAVKELSARIQKLEAKVP